MTELAEESGKSSTLSDLTLQVRLSGAIEQEVFLQHGLSLGRNPSNTLCIDHPDVERIHAQVLRQADGSMLLECASPTTQVTLADGTKTHQLKLKPGTTFKIGPATVRCLKRETKPAVFVTDNPWQVRCPRCHEVMASVARDAHACPACDAELFYFKQQTAEGAGGFEGWLPRQIGPYAIRAFVAQGGMGIVLRGLHKENDRPAAVKLLRGDTETDPSWKTRFEAEIGTLISLKHPNVVRLQDSGRDDKLVWLAMDWIDGVPLTHWIAKIRQTPIPIDQIRGAMSQIISGLQYLHGKQIVHRDLKPGNILVAQDDLVKMVDFGIARSSSGDTNLATRMTQTGMVTGTESYMAPEQAEGRAATTASDIYAMGVIWYELLTGRRPMGAFVSPEVIRTDTPINWSRAIARCLANDPASRPTLEELARTLSGAPAAPPPLPGNYGGAVAAIPVQAFNAPQNYAPPTGYAPQSSATIPQQPAQPQTFQQPIDPRYQAPPQNYPGAPQNYAGTGQPGGNNAVRNLANQGTAAVNSFLQQHPPQKMMDRLGPLMASARKNPKVLIAGGAVLVVIIILIFIHNLGGGSKPAAANAPGGGAGTPGGANPMAMDPKAQQELAQKQALAELQTRANIYQSIGQYTSRQFPNSQLLNPTDNRVKWNRISDTHYKVNSIFSQYNYQQGLMHSYPFVADMQLVNGRWEVESFDPA